ncbi:hypothetical protein LCGC14_1868580 [marine sediment metagenome]|uniref:Uncharacterized protein n=1 Tax=marine sediment metagenome TaxID=412755 RepID=A0A0F9G5P9_9ZZZZ
MHKQMNDFPHLRAVSDKDAYDFVKSQSLLWVQAIEEEIKNGKTPEEILDWWANEYGRDKMATRIFHAARHIFRERSGGK